MKCSNCQADVTLTAKFCPSCGTAVTRDQDIKSASEVSPEWLKTILESQGYKVEIDKYDANALTARHDSRPNLMMTVRSNIPLVTIQSVWTLKKPAWGKKTDFLAALNKANGTNWLCTAFATDSMDTLLISTFIYLTDRLSNRDIAVFLEIFSDGVVSVIENSGIKEFA